MVLASSDDHLIGSGSLVVVFPRLKSDIPVKVVEFAMETSFVTSRPPGTLVLGLSVGSFVIPGRSRWSSTRSPGRIYRIVDGLVSALVLNAGSNPVPVGLFRQSVWSHLHFRSASPTLSPVSLCCCRRSDLCSLSPKPPWKKTPKKSTKPPRRPELEIYCYC